MTDDQPKRGRPSDYSFQVAISICARLAEGKSLRAICSEAGMPGRATVFRWIAGHKEFRDEYTLASVELRLSRLHASFAIPPHSSVICIPSLHIFSAIFDDIFRALAFFVGWIVTTKV
jgi:hypothetical protein